MIPYLGCETARELLEPFMDGELDVDAQVAVEAHLRWCRTCTARVEDLTTIGAAVRVGPPSVRPDVDDGRSLGALQSAVLTRVRAERDQSFGVQFRELFSDRRLLWPALGASVAVLISLCGAFAVMHFATVERPDSLAALIASVRPEAVPGSDANPLSLDPTVLAPRISSDVAALDRITDDEAVLAVATVVTREGRVANYELLLPRDSALERGTSAHSDGDVAALLHAVKQSRFRPAQQGSAGRPVAVNMVWLFARTTAVRERDTQLEQLLHGRPHQRQVERVEPARVPEVAKPAAAGPPDERSAVQQDSTTA